MRLDEVNELLIHSKNKHLWAACALLLHELLEKKRVVTLDEDNSGHGSLGKEKVR